MTEDVGDGPLYVVRRSWLERLFSRDKRKIVIRFVPPRYDDPVVEAFMAEIEGRAARQPDRREP